MPRLISTIWSEYLGKILTWLGEFRMAGLACCSAIICMYVCMRVIAVVFLMYVCMCSVCSRNSSCFQRVYYTVCNSLNLTVVTDVLYALLRRYSAMCISSGFRVEMHLFLLATCLTHLMLTR
jgi:hypothetical protein